MKIGWISRVRVSPWQLLGWAVALCALLAAARLIGAPDAREALREADVIFGQRHYHEALGRYAPLSPALPAAQLRLGVVRALRGERPAAERALRGAMQRGLRPAEYQLALIYLGRVLAEDGRAALAAQTWRLADDCRSPQACAYRAPARLLGGEEALRRGDYGAAEAAYRAALAEPMPPGWAELARYRLALLRAPLSPAQALAELRAPPEPVAPPEPLLAPALPAAAAGADQLAGVLAEPAERRPQQLGQLYLGLGLHGLAEDQFARVDPRGPDASAAAAYAAYTRYRAGDPAGGLARLEELVARHPDEPRARTLLALAYISADAADAAAAEIETVARLTPSDPDIQLAWASWYAARRDYAEAALAYDRAVGQAPERERGRYALLGARFHLVTSYDQCEAGLPMAEFAGATLAAEPGALTTLAALRYHCGRFAEAASAAREAQARGAGPDAAYYLGAALAALGQPGDARIALIHAADLAPASIWRERAELALAAIP
jgi:Flp pilus assembly protein TadD